MRINNLIKSIFYRLINSKFIFRIKLRYFNKFRMMKKFNKNLKFLLKNLRIIIKVKFYNKHLKKMFFFQK
jgi:hypothetical protein